MSHQRTSLLFSPPLPPVELAPGSTVAIGRSPDCGLQIPHQDASRRHCEVQWSGDRVRVRDLGSTNGTYVNGARVDRERELRPGDRIEIGSSTITYCVVGSGIEAVRSDRVDAETTLVVRTAGRGVMQGDLAEIPLFAVLQMIEMGHKSGLLEVDTPEGAFRLWIGSGQPLHAESDSAKGIDAAFALVGLQAGHFRFELGRDPSERSIEISMTELLLEGSRLLDESSR